MIQDNETKTVDIRVNQLQKLLLDYQFKQKSVYIHPITKVEDVISFYNFATGTLLDELSTLIKSSNGSSTWRPLITYKNILRAIENIGTEMSLGLRLLGYLIISSYLFTYFLMFTYLVTYGM